uniref:(California timema) hypothetical protein n=1 Tax=Timema californicum TaxID=61474 RepID=A0A7R9J407_TIMCA|nr:unnamed protein product [Timema californicum]
MSIRPQEMQSMDSGHPATLAWWHTGWRCGLAWIVSHRLFPFSVETTDHDVLPSVPKSSKPSTRSTGSGSQYTPLRRDILLKYACDRETMNKFTPDLSQRVFDPWTSDKKEQLPLYVRNSSPDRDSNLDLPFLGSQVQHEISTLANYAIEAAHYKELNKTLWKKEARNMKSMEVLGLPSLWEYLTFQGYRR